ncbi:pheromone-processing carboxypeptidase KEX1-like [Scyliorhinus canicula]|uniref:pheromone-processing carboxypeptidase KEX1-like n=1 Tax=Scyliorhinus canicula TaxID=7830 RepID=UPI0018F700AE|nr:pheromone-processing carboxypeptidase KEX1-like [Scyliorhinus canicula]
MSYFAGETFADDDDSDDDYDDDNSDDHDGDEENGDSDDEPEEGDYEMLFRWFGSSDEVVTRNSQSAQDNDKCETSEMACAEVENEIAAVDTSAESKSTANDKLIIEEIIPILEKLAPGQYDESSSAHGLVPVADTKFLRPLHQKTCKKSRWIYLRAVPQQKTKHVL